MIKCSGSSMELYTSEYFLCETFSLCFQAFCFRKVRLKLHYPQRPVYFTSSNQLGLCGGRIAEISALRNTAHPSCQPSADSVFSRAQLCKDSITNRLLFDVAKRGQKYRSGEVATPSCFQRPWKESRRQGLL